MALSTICTPLFSNLIPPYLRLQELSAVGSDSNDNKDDKAGQISTDDDSDDRYDEQENEAWNDLDEGACEGIDADKETDEEDEDTNASMFPYLA